MSSTPIINSQTNDMLQHHDDVHHRVELASTTVARQRGLSYPDYSSSMIMMITPTPRTQQGLDCLCDQTTAQRFRSLPWYIVFAKPEVGDIVQPAILLSPYTIVHSINSGTPDTYTRLVKPLTEESYIAFLCLNTPKKFNVAGVELKRRPFVPRQLPRYDLQELNVLKEAVALRSTYTGLDSSRKEKEREVVGNNIFSLSLLKFVGSHIRRLQKLQQATINTELSQRVNSLPFTVPNNDYTNGIDGGSGLPGPTQHSVPPSMGIVSGPMLSALHPALYPAYRFDNLSHRQNTTFIGASRLSTGYQIDSASGFTHFALNQQGAAAAVPRQTRDLGVGNSADTASFLQPQPTHVPPSVNDYYPQTHLSLFPPVLNLGPSEAPVGFVADQEQALANACTLDVANNVNGIDRVDSLAEEHEEDVSNPKSKERQANTNTQTLHESQSQSSSRGKKISAPVNKSSANEHEEHDIPKKQRKATGSKQIVAQSQHQRFCTDVASQHMQPWIVNGESQGYAIEAHEEGGLNPMSKEQQDNTILNSQSQPKSQSQTSRGKKRSAPDNDNPSANDEEHVIRPKKQRKFADSQDIAVQPQQQFGLGAASQHMQPLTSTVNKESQGYAIQAQKPSPSSTLSVGNSQSNAVNRHDDSISPALPCGAFHDANEGLHQIHAGFQDLDNENLYHRDPQNIANDFFLHEVSPVLGSQYNSPPHEHLNQLQNFDEAISEFLRLKSQVSYPAEANTSSGSQTASVPSLPQDFDHGTVSQEQLENLLELFQENFQSFDLGTLFANDTQETLPHVP